MLLDMHAHSSGISWCCKADSRAALETARSVGIDGLVLCNHYQEIYVENGDAGAFAEKYVAEYESARAIAEGMGMPLYFGVEVTAKLHDNAHILLYGLEPDFVLRHPRVYEYPLEKLAEAVHSEGGIVVQAHPFRGRGYLLDTRLLDGVEVNCHPLYDATHCARLMDIARRDGIFVTCGGDYHADAYRAVCGVHFPEGVSKYGDIVEYLKMSDEIRLHVHELRTEEHGDVTFRKRAE